MPLQFLSPGVGKDPMITVPSSDQIDLCSLQNTEDRTICIWAHSQAICMQLRLRRIILVWDSLSPSGTICGVILAPHCPYSSCSLGGTAQADSLAHYQQQLIEEGVPEQALQMVLAPWRPRTISLQSPVPNLPSLGNSVKKDPSSATLEVTLRMESMSENYHRSSTSWQGISLLIA